MKKRNMRAKKMKNCIFSSQPKLEDGQIKEVTTKLRIRANRKPRSFKRRKSLTPELIKCWISIQMRTF